jgi:hypothetical protein
MTERLQTLFCVGFCLIASNSFAVEVNETQFTALSQVCRARQPIGQESDTSLTDTAKRIRDTAIEEHKLFVGSSVDHTGRIIFFGHAETESDQENENVTVVQTETIPWRRVLSHWENVRQHDTLTDAHSALTVWYYPGALSQPLPATVSRTEQSLKDILEQIANKVDFSKTDNPEQTKAAVIQSLIRASLSDVAWSGVFISDILKRAETKSFRFTSRHREYINDAIQQSLKDVGDKTGANYYRACDPVLTKPRVGDLYCYHRHISA